MFASILSDRVNFGSHFLNVIQIKSHYLVRHMVASFLLDRQVENIMEIALPII